jgi:16S rRNA (guanine(527)-N(7))-methyltransferase RsmG
MFRELLRREFSPYGRLAEEQLALLERHYQLLEQWNERMNLTRIQSLEESVRLHYCESLFVATRLPSARCTVADVGAGSGFPGIPIAVFRPEWAVTLVESHQRKAVFLREASRALPNVRVFGGRAEDLSEKFDWVVARAVDPRSVLRVQLAPRNGLLIGRADADVLGATSIEAIPWGTDRVLATFHVELESEVPRETSGQPW